MSVPGVILLSLEYPFVPSDIPGDIPVPGDNPLSPGISLCPRGCPFDPIVPLRHLKTPPCEDNTDGWSSACHVLPSKRQHRALPKADCCWWMGQHDGRVDGRHIPVVPSPLSPSLVESLCPQGYPFAPGDIPGDRNVPRDIPMSPFCPSDVPWDISTARDIFGYIEKSPRGP
jgi:hypothetical protein